MSTQPRGFGFSILEEDLTEERLRKMVAARTEIRSRHLKESSDNCEYHRIVSKRKVAL